MEVLPNFNCALGKKSSISRTVLSSNGTLAVLRSQDRGQEFHQMTLENASRVLYYSPTVTTQPPGSSLASLFYKFHIQFPLM